MHIYYFAHWQWIGPAQLLIDRHSLFKMEVSWDRVTPTPEQWDLLGSHAFKCLEDIKGQQSTISSRALLELLCHMGEPQATAANLTKPRMAALIAGTLTPHKGWAMAELTNVRLASSSQDAADLSSFVFGLELVSDSPIRLFFPRWGRPPRSWEWT